MNEAVTLAMRPAPAGQATDGLALKGPSHGFGPRLMLLDEPTVGLDIGSRQGILEHVRRRIRDRWIAMLWVTHPIDEVGQDDKVTVPHVGRILAKGAVDKVVRASGAGTIHEAYTRLTLAADR